MTQATISSFTIYNDEFYGGMTDVIAQAVDKFNAASNGAIVLSSQMLKGDYNKEAFFDVVSSLVSRRDNTSTSTAADIAMTTDNLVGVKLRGKIGPVGVTLDAWKGIGMSDREMSFILGKQVAKAKLQYQLNVAFKALVAALGDNANLCYDNTGQTVVTLNHKALNAGRALLGDRADAIRCWVGHSAPYFDIVGNSLESGALTDNIAGMVVNQGKVGTLGLPYIMTDSTNLYSSTTYYVLGLQEGAVVIRDSEPGTIETQLVTGYENMFVRVQGEFAFNMNLKGMRWDTSTGGANPTEATVGTSGNWDKCVASDKDLPGVRIAVTHS